MEIFVYYVREWQFQLANKVSSAYHFKYFQNNPILKETRDYTNHPRPPKFESLPYPGKVACSNCLRKNEGKGWT